MQTVTTLKNKGSMKIIEAMKQIKELQVKAEDLRGKVGKHCANMSFETEVYPDQKGQVGLWIQSHGDVLKNILDLRFRIQKTNITTDVTIELAGQPVKKTIAEWIHRRRDLANTELVMWSQLTDRNLKEGALPVSVPGATPTQVTIRRYYDPVVRDQKIELYRSEPSIIDRTLEVVNATVDLMQ